MNDVGAGLNLINDPIVSKRYLLKRS